MFSNSVIVIFTAPELSVKKSLKKQTLERAKSKLTSFVKQMTSSKLFLVQPRVSFLRHVTAAEVAALPSAQLDRKDGTGHTCMKTPTTAARCQPGDRPTTRKIWQTPASSVELEELL